jgi:Ca2+-binding EF-hand superfamily protein
VNEIVKQVDANGDGQISFEEFAAMMKKLSA